MRSTWIVTLFGLTSLLATTACSKKTPECNSVVEVINDFGTKAKSATGTDPKAHAAALKTAADVEEKAAADLGKLTITIPDLSKHVKSLQTNLKAHAVATRDLAGFLAKLPDAAASKAVETKMEKAHELLDLSEHELEVACDDKEDECKSFAAKLKEQPDASGVDTSDPAKVKAWQASVDKWAGDLAKADVKDEAIKKSLANVQSAIKEIAAHLVALSAMNGDEPKREAAQKAAEKAGTTIGADIDALNTYCQAP
ncbi:MAG TPA: hypothetical protein VGM56_19200 [Byssovorax sp.]|jgi:hypothetical protein